MAVAFEVLNQIVPTAPPSFFAPSATGAVVPTGATGWELQVDSAAYAAGSTADLTIQYQYSGVWQDDAGVGGFTLGTRTLRTGGTSTVNTLSSSIGPAGGGPVYPSRVRLRVDSIPAGTLARVTVNVA